MNASLIFALVVAGVAIALLAVYANVRIERRRGDAFRHLAQMLGLVPAGESASLPERATRFPVMNTGRSRKVTNLHAGALDGLPVVLFDYRYTTGGGKNSQTHRHTVAVFPETGRPLPDFELSPEHLVARIGQLFGYQDIDLPEDEEFSRKYLLRGTDADAIRRAFNAEARALLNGSPGWRIECRGGAVAMYRREGRWKPQDLHARLAEARRIAGALG